VVLHFVGSERTPTRGVEHCNSLRKCYSSDSNSTVWSPLKHMKMIFPGRNDAKIKLRKSNVCAV
jgi:hypothetical protein